ncbi:MAG: hypothetical protein AAFX56_04210 [Pseudomonadota bacterium]
MQRLSFGLLLVFLLTLCEPAWSGGWGRVFAIEVHGDGFAKPLVITDSEIVDELTFWVGPGTRYRTFMGPVDLEASIVDWDRGEAVDRPEGLASYEVRFLLEPKDNPPAYIVLYEPDPANGSGYIYYTGKGGNIVYHGVSGTWRYASPRWNERVGAKISRFIEQ